MADRSAIEWVRADDGAAGATWNPVTGCSKVTGSPGCGNCYAETFTERWRGVSGHHFENGFDVQPRPEQLGLPLRWRRPRRVFVNSLSDLFHKQVPDEFIARVFAVMSQAPRHTFLILTKRPGRMRSLLTSDRWVHLMGRAAAADHKEFKPFALPLLNVLLGVSAEDQRWADVRVPVLLDTPAAARFVSAEPLLGPLQLGRWLVQGTSPRVDWVIAGGESGHGARPMHPQWARRLRDDCVAAGVPYFFKQWGAWQPFGAGGMVDPRKHRALVGLDGAVDVDGDTAAATEPRARMARLGKGLAGRELDGRTWDEWPPLEVADPARGPA